VVVNGVSRIADGGAFSLEVVEEVAFALILEFAVVVTEVVVDNLTASVEFVDVVVLSSMLATVTALVVSGVTNLVVEILLLVVKGEDVSLLVVKDVVILLSVDNESVVVRLLPGRGVSASVVVMLSFEEAVDSSVVKAEVELLETDGDIDASVESIVDTLVEDVVGVIVAVVGGATMQSGCTMVQLRVRSPKNNSST